jgi:hypothetical protein
MQSREIGVIMKLDVFLELKDLIITKDLFKYNF